MGYVKMSELYPSDSEELDDFVKIAAELTCESFQRELDQELKRKDEQIKYWRNDHSDIWKIFNDYFWKDAKQQIIKSASSGNIETSINVFTNYFEIMKSKDEFPDRSLNDLEEFLIPLSISYFHFKGFDSYEPHIIGHSHGHVVTVSWKSETENIWQSKFE